MKYQPFAVVVPLALFLSACTSVEPAYKDIGTRVGPCASGGPDSVAQQFYDLRVQHPSQGLPDAQLMAKYRPLLSDSFYQTLINAQTKPNKTALLTGDIFSSQSQGATDASVADASTIPNTDARNIPLRVTLKRGDISWQDEVLMVREGTCWAVSDVRYLGHNPHLSGGSLSQLLQR